MRHLSTILRGLILAALVLALAAVTAGAAVGGGGAAAGAEPATPPAESTAPAAAGTAPGQAATTPGQAGTAPGQAGATPAPGATAPGRARTTPGLAGTTPRQAGATPGRSGTAPLPVPPAVAPVVGESMAVKPVDGTVKVRLPRSSGYVSLSDPGSVPSGAVVDTRAGTVLLRTALDAAGHTQAARVGGAVFEVRQAKDGEGMTELILRGGRPRGCPARGAAPVARAAGVATAGRAPRTRRLWADDDHGRFRSRGRNSAATVRGTEWITTETCAGTQTKVVKGAVDVFDRHTKRTVRVRAGQSYVARDAG